MNDKTIFSIAWRISESYYIKNNSNGNFKFLKLKTICNKVKISKIYNIRMLHPDAIIF